MATNSYNDIGTANSVKLLKTISVYNDNIMVYTEIDSHIEVGDKVFITIIGDIGDISENSIILDNLYSSNIETLYNEVLCGYNVIYVDKSKNAIVINKNINEILDTDIDVISSFTLENQYISKVSIHNIILDKGSVNGATIKHGIINNNKIDNNISWTQGTMFSGEIYNTILSNKYDSSYITLRKLEKTEKTEKLNYIFTANNTEVGKYDGYSYFNNIIIQDCHITNGNFNSCDLKNTGDDDNYINGGMFNGCNYVEYKINNGYHKDIIDLNGCIWNNGFFDCKTDGYSFKLDKWNNGTFVQGTFGGYGQKPIWVNGIFNNGIFDSYRWEDGEFNNGIFGANGKLGTYSNSTYTGYEAHLGITKRRSDGNLLNSSYSDNIYEYTSFLNGTINGGFFIRTKIKNAIAGNGIITDSIILNIKNIGGMIIDCTIKGGESLGGYIKTNMLSAVVNDCLITDTELGIFNINDTYVKNYISGSLLVESYMDAYSLYINNSTKIFINRCSLISPICRIPTINNAYSSRVFINKQNYISGGIYENIHISVPQDINGGNFKNVKIENNINPNSVFCSVRPVRVLERNYGEDIPSKVFTMFEFDNKDDKELFNKLNNNRVYFYGYFYTKLQLNSFGNTNIIDFMSLPILNETIYYNPKKYNNETEKFDNIDSNTKEYVIVGVEYSDYMFGDFGILYSRNSGIFNDSFIINGGNFDNCNIKGTNNNKTTINGGNFNNTNFNGNVEIYSCNFNGGTISGDINTYNTWRGGNFNSGVFGIKGESSKNFTLQLKKSAQAYLTNQEQAVTSNTPNVEEITGEMSLVSIYPLIIKRTFTNNNIYDTLGDLHDKEYQEFYLDIWNESNIDFTALTAEQPWADTIIDTDNYLLIPSHFVFIIKNETKEVYLNMLSFIQKRTHIDIIDVRTKEAYYSIYNALYKDSDGINKPVNDFFAEYVNYYTKPNSFDIAIIFKFPKIEELYNNTLNKNQIWFDNIFKDYNLYFKNVWSDANAGYFVRPMPVFDERDNIEYDGITALTNYGSYPDVTFTGNCYQDNLPAPWHFDNNGKLWLPLHQGSIKNYYNDYKTNIQKYVKEYFKNTNDILPFSYFNFRRNNDFSFNRFLPSTKRYKNDIITDSIDVNLNIKDYVNYDKIGEETILSIVNDNCWLYKGGWEDYYDMPFNFKTTSITDVNESWIYLEQYYGINKTILDDMKSNSVTTKLLHVISHNEDFTIDFDGPCRLLDHGNFMSDTSLYKLKIDQKISNNYGHVFVVDSKNFIFDNVNKQIQIPDFGDTNYSVKAGKHLYLYTISINSNVTTISKYKVTIASNGILDTNGTTMTITISENINITSPMSNNFVYGLDSWDIYSNDTPSNTSQSVQRLDIIADINRPTNGFDGNKIPSNEKTNKWVSGDPLFIYSTGLNTIKTTINPKVYPNDYVQGKLISIKNIKEDYDGMYLYDSIFDYNETKDADKVNVYLYDSIDNIPDYNKTWIKDSNTINVIGNNIDFGTNLVLLEGTQKLEGTVIRYKNFGTFKKTTNLYKINAEVSTSSSDNITQIGYNKDYIEIHNKDGYSILSGVFEKSQDDYSITIESSLKTGFTNSTLIDYSTYSIRTLLTTNNDITLKRTRGNHIEFYKKLDKTLLYNPITVNVVNGIKYIKFRYDQRDTWYGQIMNLKNYINSIVTICAKKGNDYVYYSGTLHKVIKIEQNIYEAEIILEQDTAELLKVEYGYFFIKEEMSKGPCYRYFTSTIPGREIPEGSTYHFNYGDPSKPIYKDNIGDKDDKKHPKQILRVLNEKVRTTESNFERQAGLIINSTYDLNTGKVQDTDRFYEGNFYSGDFFGVWDDGDWFASENSFKGENNYNKERGLDFTKAPSRKESTVKNFTDIINTLLKRGEYFMYPPWSNKERQIVITPKITRSDEY